MNSLVEDRIQEARWEIAEEEGIDIMEVTDKALVYCLAESLLFDEKEDLVDLKTGEELEIEEAETIVKESRAKVEEVPAVSKKPRVKNNEKCNYKFMLIDLKTKKSEPWTGVFPSEKAADAWYVKFGDNTIPEGKKLVKTKVKYYRLNNKLKKKK